MHLAIAGIRLAQQPALAGVKHCNRLEQVIARQQLDALGVDEGILLDTEGAVIEGCAANLFILEGDRLLTPVLSECGVAGVMRDAVLQSLAKKSGLEAAETLIDLPRLLACDGIMLCNSVRGVSTVASLRTEDGGRRVWDVPQSLAQLQSLVAASMEAV